MNVTRTLILPVLACILITCKKEKQPEPTPVEPSPYYIRMTDATGPYTAVNIDLKAIEITSDGNAATLNTAAGIYNLLNFTNGADTLIATANLYVDKIQQIRLILGPNNSVVSGGKTYSLEIPSSAESGLKLQVHQQLEAGVAYRVLLDFDANQSIVQQGNGNYQLKPVIRTIETALSGAIRGQLSPGGVGAAITATSSSGAYSSAPNANGDFIIRGLPAGNYSINIVPASPYNATTLNNVQVVTGITTTLGVIHL